ncbi:MAG TPA: ABC transporter ATP-binding protein [Chloroflexota bacterium]|nr:ABC transporter ATP-binding protein [Chloroflexota bacterium]
MATRRDGVLRAEGITAGYGPVPIVREASISAEAGQIVAILGPNGAGKSTLLKTIFGYLKPQAGHVFLQGVEVTGLAPEALVSRGIGYVPQVGNVFPTLTVRENLEMGAYLRHGGVQERVEAVLSIFPDVGKALERRAGTLSGGQRSMLAMGRGLMLDPTVLLLDEPTAGLAPEYTREVWRQIQRVAESGTAVVVVEQNATAALQAADWAYILVAGRNRHDDRAGTLLDNPDLGRMFLGG